MLIIFDLDDTLVETSLCLTQEKLRDALSCIQATGHVFPDFEDAYRRLLAYNAQVSSSKEALTLFGEAEEIHATHLQLGLKELQEGKFALGTCLHPVEGACELLSFLAPRSTLALVSFGDADRQRWKMEKAGIDSAIFYKILFLQQGSKKNAYQLLMQELGEDPASVWVCGDRIVADLDPAKELGCHTVHVKRGRGLLSSGSADVTVYNLSEIERIFLK